jgi:hypothetical protein
MKEQIALTKRLINFVKYNNAFVIGLVLVLFGGGAIFAASPDARSAVVGREVVTVQGVDNSRIINADLENFDFQVKIDNVTEDAANYYVDYSFRTIGIEANVWQTITRNLQMTVAKDALAGQDLGLYVQAQLANIAQNELAYLEQAQSAEKEKGLTQIVCTTDYTGLIGLVLDVKNAVLPGYDPVVKPEPVELAQNIETQIPQEPEILEPEIIENATTTQEVATEEPQSEAGAAEPTRTEQTPETQTQTPENDSTTATSTTGEQAEAVPAETATESENSEQPQAEPEPSPSITSETTMPDVSATSTTE